MKRVFVALLMVGVAGCGGGAKQESDGAGNSGPAGGDAGVARTAAVVVTVNGEALTTDRLEADLAPRLESIRKRVPADKMAQVREQMRSNLVEQFIVRTLLLAEAEKRGLAASAEEEQEAYAEIGKALPEGKTIEQVMAESPIGKDRMREEVLVGIRINKLLGEIVKDSVSVTEEEVAAFREDNLESLKLPESARARHILIPVASDDDADAKKTKREQAESIRQELVDGGDFAELAKAHSSCPSKQRGGDLGKFARGQMVKPFEEAAFSQEIGAIGEVVETRFGYHIIEVLEREDGGIRSDEDIADILTQRKQKQVVGDFIESLKAQAEVTYGK